MQRLAENKRAVVAAVVALGAVGAAAYYLYQSPPPPPSEDGSKAKKKKKAKKSAAPKPSETLHGFPATRDAEGAPLYAVVDADALAGLSAAERKQIAEEFKAAGNYAFNHKQFDRALELYGQAIAADASEPVFYSNRAAVWGSLKNYEEVLKDTTSALQLAPDYVKCYSRRAVAYEQLNDYENASLDYLSACTLRGFEDDAVTASVDRAVKAWAEETLPSVPLLTDLPSSGFVSAYITSWTPPVVPESVHEATSGTHKQLRDALDAMSEGTRAGYTRAVELVRAACDAGFGDDAAAGALALETRSMFEYLQNDVDSAVASVDASLALKPTAVAYLMRAVMRVEQNDASGAQEDFELARAVDPASPDLHYQLGQFAFLQQQWQSAIDEYDQCIAAQPDFVLAHIQREVAEYRAGRVDAAKRGFARLEKEFPQDSNVQNFFGEVCLDCGDAAGALAHFDSAIALEKRKPEPNALPMVNKCLALVNFAKNPSDIERARALCAEAEAVDPLSSIVVSTGAQLALQSGDYVAAAELFDRTMALARTDGERLQARTLALTAQLQSRIAVERPVIHERMELLTQMAAGLQA